MSKTQNPSTPKMTTYRSSEIIKAIVTVAAALVFIGVVIPTIIITLIIFFSTYSSTHVSESTVRKLWKETGMANSEYYHFTENESKATDDRIYLELEEIPGEITWGCSASGLGRICSMGFSDGGGMPNGGDDLGGYFWGKHWSEIANLLAKYPGLSERL